MAVVTQPTDSQRPLNELGFYTLAGAPESPRDMLDELRAAEQHQLGAAFISERFNIKEAVTLSGAAGAVTENIRIITGATNHNTRHPMVTASYASTMHELTGGRFTLGIGRGIAPMFDAYGIPRITTAQMEDFVSVMRRLWSGDTIIGHDGPIGSYPVLRLDPRFNLDVPLALTAFGPNSLDLGGRLFDDIILHTFFTDFTTHPIRVRHVRFAAELSLRSVAEPRENGTCVQRQNRNLRIARTTRPEGRLRQPNCLGGTRPREWFLARSS